MPYRELYWAVAPDAHNAAVLNAMSRKRFRDTISNFYLANLAEINADQYSKMSCLFDIPNCNFKKHLRTNDHNIEETMIPYLGKHEIKQFLCSKPILFGFKLWCLASTDGYLFYGEPYYGADTKMSDIGVGKGVDVVLSLAEKGGLSNGFFVTFDNLFTSFPLLDELSKGGIGGLVTIRQNCLKSAAISSK